MLHKGFLRNHDPEIPRNDRKGLRIINVTLYAGVCIILAGLFFMLINLENADTSIHYWIPILAVGVILVFLSFLIRLNKEWHHR